VSANTHHHNFILSPRRRVQADGMLLMVAIIWGSAFVVQQAASRVRSQRTIFDHSI